MMTNTRARKTNTFRKSAPLPVFYYIQTENTVALEQFFIVMEKSGDEGSIYCDHDLVAQAAAGRRMRFEELIGVYPSYSEESMGIKGNLRKIACQHHLEWNKRLFNNALFTKKIIFGENRAHLTAKVGKHDLWTNPDGSEAAVPELPTKGQVWFAHPVYFMEQMSKEGLLDKSFNPYKNKEPSSFSISDIHLESLAASVVKSNPGFAPAVPPNTAAANKIVFENRNFSWYFSSPFGILRRGSDGVQRRHSGIDLATGRTRNMPIIALVHGVVWARSPDGKEDSTFGKVMFIKGTGADSDKLYFLAHLDRFLEKGVDQTVDPGDEVAITGNTGSTTRRPDAPNSGIHLHLEVFVNVPDRKEDVLNMDTIKNGVGFDSWWKPNFNFAANRRDPFNHNRRIHGNQVIEG